MDTETAETLLNQAEEDDVDGSADLPGAVWKDLPPEDRSDPVDHVAQRAEHIDGWKIFGASKRGRSHAHAGTYREDAFEFGMISPKEPVCWAIAVSDGAGSCRLSRVGSNLSVSTVISILQEDGAAPSDPKKALENAVEGALTSLEKEAAERQCDIGDLSCTLLVLLWTHGPQSPGGTAVTFQAGDGLIASFDEDAQLNPLAVQDTEAFAGATHFLTSKIVRSTWDKRFKSFQFETPPKGFLVMSDGVADDLIPYARNGPILVKELQGISEQESAGEAMIELLAYEKRGSFDDRTLVCALIHRPHSGSLSTGSNTPSPSPSTEGEVENA